MSFLRSKEKFPRTGLKRKNKALKIISAIFVIAFILIGSFAAYLYATGSKVFNPVGGESALFKAIKGSGLDGEGEGKINILFAGRGGDNHPGGRLTDSIMVVSIKPKEKKIAMMSVPRDLYVTIKGHGQNKINTAFSSGYDDYINKSCRKTKHSNCSEEASAAGANLMKETISNTFGIPINYYVIADFEGFKKIIDSIGGVDVYVDKNLYDPYFPDKNMKGYDPFNIKVGNHHMNGETALKFARSRETTSDFDRSARQQKIIKAVKDKTLTLGFLTNPKKILEIVTILGDHVRTDFSPSELKALAEILGQVQGDNFKTIVLSTAENGPLVSDSSSGTYYIKPRNGDYKELQKIAKNMFDDVINTSDKDSVIQVQNATSVTGQALNFSTYLKQNSYKNISVISAKESASKSQIIDYSKGASKTLIQMLEKKIGVKSTQKNTDSKYDIVIILGEDYLP